MQNIHRLPQCAIFRMALILKKRSSFILLAIKTENYAYRNLMCNT